MIHLLPTEIIDCISLYFSSKDYLQLVTVNHAFYNMFIALLYHTIDLSNPGDFDGFLSVSTRPFQEVKEISLRFDMKEERHLQNLATLFPFLNSITLRIVEDLKLSTPISPSFQHLTALDLCILYDYEEQDDTYDQMIHTVTFLLESTPNLTNLTLYLSSPWLSVDLLDFINNKCPLLEHLSVTSELAEAPDTHAMPIHHFPHLKSLHISSEYSLPAHQGWLRYVASRYPNIERLKLGCSESDPIASSPEFYDWFFLSCPHLSIFDWQDIMPDSAFLAKLSDSQRQAQHITLSIYQYTINQFFSTPSPRTAHFSTIMNLSIDIISKIDCYQFFLSLAEVCPRLEQLKVRSVCHYSENQIPICMLLDLFPCVTLMQLENITLCYSYDFSSVIHPLKDFSLRHSAFTGSELSALVLRCPNLERMTLCRIKHIEKGSLMIRSPNAVLTLLDLSYINARYDDSSIYYQLFYIEQQKAFRWYFYGPEGMIKVSEEQLIAACKELNTDEQQELKSSSPRISALLDRSVCTLESNVSLLKAIKIGYVEVTGLSIRTIYIEDNKISN